MATAALLPAPPASAARTASTTSAPAGFVATCCSGPTTTVTGAVTAGVAEIVVGCAGSAFVATYGGTFTLLLPVGSTNRSVRIRALAAPTSAQAVAV